MTNLLEAAKNAMTEYKWIINSSRSFSPTDHHWEEVLKVFENLREAIEEEQSKQAMKRVSKYINNYLRQNDYE